MQRTFLRFPTLRPGLLHEFRYPFKFFLVRCSPRPPIAATPALAHAPAHTSQGMPPAPVPAAAASAPVAPAVPVAPVVRPRPCPPASHPQCLPSCTSACSPAGAHTCGRRACRVPVAPAPAADTFAVMRFVKSNVSRQSGVRKSSNARQFSSIIHACKCLRQAKNAVLKHPAPFVLLLKNKPCEQPL